MEPDDIEISDKGGVFDKVHVDNTPLEKMFEDLFVETYGNGALGNGVRPLYGDVTSTAKT